MEPMGHEMPKYDVIWQDMAFVEITCHGIYVAEYGGAIT